MSKRKTCKAGKEKNAKGRCVKTCKSTERRNRKGRCVSLAKYPVTMSSSSSSSRRSTKAYCPPCNLKHSSSSHKYHTPKHRSSSSHKFYTPKHRSSSKKRHSRTSSMFGHFKF